MMIMNEPVDYDPVHETELVNAGEPLPTTAVAIEQPQPPALSPDPERPITPAQARVEAVAEMLKNAYAKASDLVLTKEEAAALAEDFPDEAFRRGAGGDDNLVYIEHAYLRQRLNKVLGVGAAVPIRRREWAEEFQYRNKKGELVQAVRIYADVCLVVRGCLVGEAVGDGVYYKNNERSNYGDALESAKSNALRRCCKEFGVGLQVWMKDWCEGWKKRNGHSEPERREFRPAPTASKPAVVAPPKPADPPKEATAKTREWFITEIKSAGLSQQEATEYYVKTGRLLDTETISDLPLDAVPTTKQVAHEAIARIKAFVAGATVDDSGNPTGPTNDDLRKDATILSGYVKHITKKETKRAGHFRYGILITAGPDDREGGTWVNTFSDTDAATAQGLKGQHVNVWYNEGQYGNDMVERGIEQSNEGVTP